MRMKVEIRNDSVFIDGYVNAVERDSKTLHNRSGAFVEKIKAGAFRRALARADKTSSEVRVLLNHNYDRQLTSTKDATTKLFEDSIGLRCQCEIRDADVIQKAKEQKLRGWSFGFTALSDAWSDTEPRHRDVRELELREVSILDDTRIPAYDGTSIELRDDDPESYLEYRSFDNDEMEIKDLSTVGDDVELISYQNRYLAALI